MVEHLSLRVYGILVKDKQVLIIKENIKGQAIYKLPGGGLEIGEGLADCLDRELYEELGTRFTIPPQPRNFGNQLFRPRRGLGQVIFRKR